MLTKVNSTLWIKLNIHNVERVELINSSKGIWNVEIETEDANYLSEDYTSKSLALEFAEELVNSINSTK